MEVTVRNLQRKIALNSRRIVPLTRSIFKALKVHKASLSLIFISRQKIQGLNKKYLKRPHATDVLSFDLTQKINASYLVADIFISTDAAIENARVFKTSIERELILYIIHGILHLVGYDDHRASDIKKMRRKEAEILNKITRGK